MDERRIDGMARLLATGVGRRRIATGLAGVLLGGVVLPRRVLAACNKVGRTCDKNQDCCDHADCRGKKCACKRGFDACGNDCVDLEKEEKDCGRCDNRCGAGERCAGGGCITADGCPVGADSCAGNGSVSCGDVPNCVCSPTTEGTTRCGAINTPGAVCGQCESSADCASIGDDAFCAVATGSPGPCCGLDGRNVCRLPCPVV